MRSKIEDEPLDIPGRYLYCVDCGNFTKHAVQLGKEENEEGEEHLIGKQIVCRICKVEQALLVPWGEKEWVDLRFANNIGLTLATLAGDQMMVQALMPEEEKVAEEPRSKRRPRKSVRVRPRYRKEPEINKERITQQLQREVEVRDAMAREMMGKLGKPKKSRRRPRKSVPVRPQYRKVPKESNKESKSRIGRIMIVLASLGIFHLILTYLAWNYRFFLWPFTYMWDIFDWIPVTMQTYLAGGAIVGGIVGWIVWRWRRGK